MSVSAAQPLTFFDSPERATEQALRQQRAAVLAAPMVATMLEGYPEPAVVLNAQRQVVLANTRLGAMLNCSPDSLIGSRMGEAIDCVHSTEGPHGCGTTPSCAVCGVAHVIARTNAQRTPAREDARLTRHGPGGTESLDVRATTTPVTIDGQPFVVLAFRDTTDEQRRRVLERLFFHDVLNSAGGLHGLMQIIREVPPDEAVELSDRAAHLADQVVEEIKAQRDITAAERGELDARPEPVDVVSLLEEVVALYEHHSAAEGKTIDLRPVPPGATVVTDPLLLRRVLGNLVKNALEASAAGQVVTVAFEHAHSPRFRVHNATVMPEHVRLQVFQRSFSTKGGHGRGLGTYSTRLLVERYLRGEVSFRSLPGEGTTFIVGLP